MNIDMSWVDSILKPYSYAEIHLLSSHQLKTEVMPTPTLKNCRKHQTLPFGVAKEKDAEVYKIVISEVTGSYTKNWEAKDIDRYQGKSL
jgi:hypothetical protein